MTNTLAYTLSLNDDGKTYTLVLNESSGATDTVPINLAKDAVVDSSTTPNTYSGTMTFGGSGENSGKVITLIDAQFIGETSAAVSLSITLTDTGNVYTSPNSVTTSGGGAVPSTIHASDSTTSSLTITFSDPSADGDDQTTELYFHTVQAIIDPGVEVERQPR